MDTLKSVQSLLFSESVYWQKSFVEIESRDLFDVEGEIYLMKEVEGLLYSSRNDTSSLICKCTSALPKCQAAIDSLWEKLNTGVWKEIPNYLRHLYSHASLIKSFALYKLFYYHDDVEKSIDFLKQALKSVDLGLLLGLPSTELTSAARLYSDEFRKLHLRNESGSSLSEKSAKKIRLESKTLETIDDEESGSRNFSRNDLVADAPWRKWRIPKEVPSLERPSVEKFSKEYFQQRLPVVLKNCLLHWPAMKSWSPAYLACIAGERTVPVELGPNYIHPAWGQKLMTIKEFVNKYMIHESSQDSKLHQIGYLAQHQLFEQVPELRADIKIPEYCCLSDNVDDDDEDIEEPVINAWFGPKGTVSPLHHDPKHNLLAQVVGKKRVILYSCEDSKYLHPYIGQLLDNTSQIDPEDPETTERFPDVIKAEPWECEIQAGDMLYIPPKWWHHIRSLSVSFSVSFWWQ